MILRGRTKKVKQKKEPLINVDPKEYNSVRDDLCWNSGLSGRDRQFWLYCHICGTTFYGTTIYTSKPMSKCPICGNKFEFSKKGYYLNCQKRHRYTIVGTGQRKSYYKASFYNTEDLQVIECSEDDVRDSNSNLQEFDSPSSGQNYLQIVREHVLSQKAEKKISAFINKYDVDKSKQKRSFDLDSDSFDLQKYIHNILMVETEIVSVKQRLGELYFAVLQNADEIPVGLLRFKAQQNNNILKKIELEQSKLKGKYYSGLIMPNTSVKKPKAFSEKPPIHPVAPYEPEYEQPSFFNKKKVLAQNEVLRSEYEEALMRYQNEEIKYKRALQVYNERQEQAYQAQQEYKIELARIREENEKYKEQVADAEQKVQAELKSYESKLRAENEKQEIIVPEQIVDRILKDEIKLAEKTLKELLKGKYELYSYNIIYSKYREPIALAAFDEYLSSGRCTSLRGACGAYSLFESEQRSNTIISKLNDVLESLEEIKANQRSIYFLMCDMKKDLESLNKKTDSLLQVVQSINFNTSALLDSVEQLGSTATSMDAHLEGIAKNTKAIAYNTAVTAYYSKANAELTNALGYMLALK